MIIPLNEYDFLKRAITVYGDREAVVCGNHRFTYKEFSQRVYRWANLMRSLGVGKGDRVAVLSQNCHRMLEAFFGTPLIGSILMPLNFRLISDDFNYILNHGEASVVIVEAGLTHLIDDIRESIPSIKHFIIADDDAAASLEGWSNYEALIAGASADPPQPAEIDENDPSALLYTSGTTGQPKGVMLTHRNLYLNAMNSIVEFTLNDSDVYLHTLAMFHCNGWGLPYAVTGVGGKHVVVKKFEPGAFLELAQAEGMTFACMPPTMINLTLNHPFEDHLRDRFQPGTRIGTAGSAPPLALIKGLQERLGWKVIQIYGLTETSPFLTVSKVKAHMMNLPAEEKYRVQTRTGYPMLGVELRVVDDNGNDIPADGVAVGEVIARGNVVMAGYWRQPDATSSVIVDKWFHTGDMATLDSEGMIEVVDRKKDLIISGGENVSSIEIEGMLYKHPGVLEAACIAVPDEKWGEAPGAIVVLKPGASSSEQELIEFCRDNMAHFKCPRRIFFAESLPRTATGKIQKNVLRSQFWQGRTKLVN